MTSPQSPEHRADALRIRRALLAARDLSASGEQKPQAYLDSARAHLLAEAPAGFKIDYLQLVDAETLQPISALTKPTVLAAACFYDDTRLIDNIQIHPK